MTATSSSLPAPTDYYGDAGSGLASGIDFGTEAGASGDSSKNSINISTGGMVAIIVVVVVVSLIGVSTATLFFIAKKREWKVRETLRRSAKRVATALTPRRSQFPDSVKRSVGESRPHRSGSKDEILVSSNSDLEKGYPRRDQGRKSRR